MMNHLANQMRLQASLVSSQIQTAIWGIITSYDPTTHRVVVKRQPEDIDNPDASLSNWMPLVTPWVGNGWGFKACPSAGDMVIVLHIGGTVDDQVAILAGFNDVDRPPAGSAGEFILQHKSGAYLKLSNDGSVNINGQAEISLSAPRIIITTTSDTQINAQNVNITAAESAKVTAPDIQLGANGQSSEGLVKFSDLKAYIDNHVHPAPGGNTGIPTTSLSSSAQTTTVKGG